MDPFNQLNPEELLLLRLCRLSFSADQKEELASLTRQVQNWPGFTGLATNHGISALVFHNLKELDLVKELPSDIINYMRSAYLKSLSRNTVLYEKYLELKDILEAESIEAVLLKGMALELTVYGNMGLRQMNDIDLYIDRSDCLRAWDLLIEKGYKAQPQKSRLHKKLILDIGKHLPELYKDGISFELHHRLFEKSSELRAQPACRQGRGSELVNHTVYRLPFAVYQTTLEDSTHSLLEKEFHFLYLIKHLHYHETSKAESQLRLYNDLCQVMTQCTQDIKSSGIVELAKELGLLDVLFQKFYILHIFWGMPLPGEISAALSEEKKTEVLTLFINFLRNPKGNKVRNRGYTYRNILAGIPGTTNKIRYILGDTFPSLSFMKQRYNTTSNLKASLRYPLRIGKLILLFSP
jgi:hypothetical protein